MSVQIRLDPSGRTPGDSQISNPGDREILTGRMKMTNKRTWIRENREQIDAAIRTVYSGSLNDSDREDWLMNDEGLYNWARSEGVRL